MISTTVCLVLIIHDNRSPKVAICLSVKKKHFYGEFLVHSGDLRKEKKERCLDGVSIERDVLFTCILPSLLNYIFMAKRIRPQSQNNPDRQTIPFELLWVKNVGGKGFVLGPKGTNGKWQLANLYTTSSIHNNRSKIKALFVFFSCFFLSQ